MDQRITLKGSHTFTYGFCWQTEDDHFYWPLHVLELHAEVIENGDLANSLIVLRSASDGTACAMSKYIMLSLMLVLKVLNEKPLEL